MLFQNREEAGQKLSEIIPISKLEDTVILALPRGGVPLGLIVAENHQADFDVILAKKIGHPQNSEYAIGAVAENGEPLIGEEMRYLDDRWIDNTLKTIRSEMNRRRKMYDSILKKQLLQDKEVIIVDDGIATGLTMFSAIESVKEQQPARLSVAVPIIPKDTYDKLMKQVDEVYALDVPQFFRGGVGAYYVDFTQVSDEEVQSLIENYQKN